MTNDLTLVIVRTSPFASSRAAEGLDVILATAVFEQPVAVLFMDDGVFGLRQPTRANVHKSFAKSLDVLPLYDVQQLFVHTDSMTSRAILPESVNLPVQFLSDQEVAALMGSSRHILSF